MTWGSPVESVRVDGDGVADDLPLDVEEFLTWLRVERGRSFNTLTAYRADLRSYLAWLRSQHLALDNVVETDITAGISPPAGAGPGARRR